MTEELSRDLTAVRQIEAVPVLLDILCRTAGLGFAAVTCRTGSRWIIAAAQATGLDLQPGCELQIEAAIRNESGEIQKTRVIENTAADARLQPPAGLQSYISAPILRPDGTVFGTLCGFGQAKLPPHRPETVAMVESFAELLGAQLGASARAAELLEERKTSALREQFIAVLGHDLRNPLTAILGGMEMLRKNPLNQRAEQWAEMVVASAGRMAELIDVVVDFSRSRQGGISIDSQQCDSLAPALQRLVAQLLSSKPSRRIHSRLDLDAPIPCDPRRILQLAANLLSNALMHGDPDQPIELQAATQHGRFELTVTNGGAPIQESLLARIFEPFSRGTVQPSREGMGLGLYIAQQIAAAHGGALTVSSTPQETRFSFQMPLSKEA